MELTSQVIGLIAGVITFSVTVIVTFVLLIVGGSFKRMKEQAETYSTAGDGALKQALKPRPELYDDLLEAARSLPRVPAPPVSEGGTGVRSPDARRELRGHHVKLLVLQPKEDVEKLFQACDGSTALGHAYDPDVALWALSPHGPFKSVEELAASSLMQPLDDGLRFTVVDQETNKIVGMAAILANEPSSLRAEIGDVWLNPAFAKTRALQDVYYLLLAHLFGLGYRRVEARCDAGDTSARAQLPRIGFRVDGVFRKHMIVKGCNRDTVVFSMVNADWRDGAKSNLEKLLEPEGNGHLKRGKVQGLIQAAAAAASTAVATTAPKDKSP